jgi:4-diphosphocytidyl-2-C-methyl-D-erythritol kinase
MLVFPNAKINIGLKITSKRPDGFHNIETVFYPIGLSDVLEVVFSETGKDVFTSSGITIPGERSTNLCLKALEFLRKNYNIPSLSIHLHKTIPIGAGLGGGSSDAAFFIKAVNNLCNLGLSMESQIDLANNLGSDCAFFILNKPAFGEGTGGELSLLSLSLRGKFLVLLNPALHISTAEAYSGVKPEPPAINLKENILSEKLNQWKKSIDNDFEKSIFLKYPKIREIKEGLYANGAVYASMSGSGSSVFGIFDSKPDLEKSLRQYLVWQGELD